MLSLAHFRSMRSRLRSLIFLFWVYSFVSRAVNAFSQIYIYQMFDSVQLEYNCRDGKFYRHYDWL